MTGFFMSGLLPVLCLAETAYDLNAKGGRAMEQGRSEEAVSYFKEALRLAPENKVIRANLSVSYNNLALDYDAGGDFDRANLMMEKAFAADPDSALIKKNYGMLLTNQAWRRFDGKRDESEILPLLEKALGYTTALPQAYILLGEIYFKRDEQKRAAENWDKALSLDPSLKEVKKKLKKLSKEIKTEKEFSSHSGEHFKVKFEGIELWSDAWTVLEILESVYYRLGGIFN
ncbi:MAG TPA: tetratricopeptide repeat protein, partial [bacterium]|nr:tetratricopeptide repeat protein [bacterium]